ncbi:hypothetical protein KBB96_08015 [Luteolibacter ambystomatis]|uniref:Transcription elongation factor GreAB n=1 Tax=Luteolibacter ambystomatis TaxID=2824561 RepID=A0A975J2G9_9BACT|nr:hypothetical protein [Luteolibacter ambystomatis]QUE52828.1 hypothetical protein KBB96_08015 [Luteolibacter ambystomatis]
MSVKTELLGQIRAELRTRLERLTTAARESHAAATDADSKAESKYDTRNLEASYLARGQAKQVDELAEAVRIFDTLALPDFDITAPIDAGALVEVDQDGETSFYLLAPTGGGLVVEHLGCELTVLTPESPLYQRLRGLSTGDSLDRPALMVTEVC